MLPLELGMNVLVTQGPSSEPTHLGAQRYAWDFGLEEGSPVHAAAPGFVVWVKDDSTIHGTDETLANAANWIALDHGGGLYTVYAHLDAGSASVTPGEQVEAGQLLATTGLSGQLSGPNLHFHVENVWSETVPAAFVDSDGTHCNLSPVEGDEVHHDSNVAALLLAPDQPSPLPLNAFEDLGVTRIEGLPGRILSRTQVYSFRGEVAEGFNTVALMIFEEGGGEVILGVSRPAQGKTFEGELDLSSLPPGRYGWAMVATAGEIPMSQKAIWLTVVD